MIKNISLYIIAVSTMAVCTACCKNIDSTPSDTGTGNWEPGVYHAIKDFVSTCNSEKGKEYVVFDFDNTCSIFDISEQLFTYQIETMSYELTPQAFRDALFYNLSDAPKEVVDRLDIIVSDYEYLYAKYGPFTYAGLCESQQKSISSDQVWIDFAIGLATLYEDMFSLIDTNTAYLWLYQSFTGMTPEKLYSLACRSHRRFSQMPTTERNWTLSDRKYSWNDGITVTEDIKELWKLLHDNGIDVWVCSASCLQTVMAAIDVFGLHEYCAGVVAYVYEKDEDGKLLPSYDYQDGCAAIPHADGSWTSDNLPIGCTPYAEGKVTAILSSIAPKYSCHGPSAGFGDSSGDFNFCTEFSSLKMVILFNRADRKITEGGGLVAELAVYQKEELNYDLTSANAAGDTFYLLQGRDENGFRTLQKSNSTVIFGSCSPKLFYNSDNYVQYEYFKQQSLSTADILNTFAISTPSSESPFGLAYGFLTEYGGYHSL